MTAASSTASSVAPSHVTLLEGDVGGHIRRLSAPVIWGLLSLNIFSLVDTWFIGQLGTKYLAAFGFTIPIVMLFMGALFGLSVATTSVLARVYGSGDIQKLRQMSTDALSLAFILISSVALVGSFIIDQIFRSMGAEGEVLDMVDRFMRVWYIGLPFQSISMIGYACMRATGDTKFQSSMMILSTTIMIVLDPFLIYGWAGFPRLELTGAAVAVCTANMICCAITLYRLVIKRGMLSGRIIHPDLIKSWKAILHVGVPSIVANQISPISFAIVTGFAANLGQEGVAALGISNRIENFVAIAFYSLSGGISIFSGQNYGAGNYGRVQEATRIGATYSIAVGLGAALVLFLLGRHIAGLFDSNPQVVAYAAIYMKIVPLSYCALSTMIICNAVFNAVGKPLPAMIIIALKALVIYVPLAYIFQPKFGFLGIVMALFTTNIATGIIAYVWNKKVIT